MSFSDPILRNNKSGFNINNVDTKKLKDVRFHEDTTLSKQVLKLEKKLLLELNNVMKYFKDNYIENMNPQNYQNIYEEFKRDIEISVTNIIRSYVTKTYTFTTDYISNNLGVSGFLTKSDIDVITELTNNFVERFFGRIRNALEAGVQKFYNNFQDVFIPASFNRSEEDIDNNETNFNVLIKNIERSESYIFSSLAVLIISTTLNQVTILKSKKIILNDGTLNKSPIFQAADEEDDIEDTEIPKLKYKNFFYIWKTARDERVCPQCSRLNERLFTLLDSNIPTPPDDTHYNCRCRLLLLYL